MLINYVIVLLGNFIAHFNMLLVYCNISEKKAKLSLKMFAFVFLSSLIQFIMFILEFNFLKTIYALIVIVVVNKFLYHEKILNVIFKCFFIWIFGVAFDLLMAVLYSLIISKWHFLVNYELYFILLFTIVFQSIYYFVSKSKIFRNLYKSFSNVVSKLKVGVIRYILCTFAIIISSFYAIKNLDNIYIVIFFGLISILFVSYFVFFIIYSSKVYNEKKIKEFLLNSNGYYIDLNEDYRIFKHNIFHKIESIRDYCTGKSLDLINDLLLQVNELKISNRFVDCLPSGLNGLVSAKISKYDIDFNLLVDCNSSNDLLLSLNSRKFNRFSEMFGVLIDNALNASSKSKERLVYISVFESEKNIDVMIKNSFCNVIDVDNFGKLNYTTKTHGHGLGVFSVFKMGVDISFVVNNDLFESHLVLKK